LAAVRVLSGVSSAGGGEPVRVVAAPEAFVGDHDLRLGAGEQVGERLVFLLVGGHEGVAERKAAAVGEHDQPHAVDEPVLRLRVAVAGEAGELAPLGAAAGSSRPRAASRR